MINVLKHKRLVEWTIAKYFYHMKSLDIFEDLKQEGIIGLITAAERYDSTLSKFSTYATLHIYSRITRYCAKNYGDLPLPISYTDKFKFSEYDYAVLSEKPVPPNYPLSVTPFTNKEVLIDLDTILTNAGYYKKIPYKELFTGYFLEGLGYTELQKKYRKSSTTINLAIKELNIILMEYFDTNRVQRCFLGSTDKKMMVKPKSKYYIDKFNEDYTKGIRLGGWNGKGHT